MHYIRELMIIILVNVYQGRLNIEKKSTSAPKFVKCNNSKCGIIFLLDSRKIAGEEGFLCGSCRPKIDTHHIVQCTNCQSIINFIPSDFMEEPVLYYVKKCSRCTGTKEDEWRIIPFQFPDAFM